jgi:hypothetical protein
MARSFSKKGLRRDLNFIDIPNPEQALNNLLNGLIEIEGETFTSADLDAIRELRSSSMSNADFLNITGIAAREIDNNGVLQVYSPLVKIKNRVDAITFTTGVPQFFGGNGLTAKYYPDDQVDSEAVSSDNIFTGDPQETEIFWENGNFNFTTFTKLQSIFGGISYTGYLKPTEIGEWLLRIATSSFFTLEFDDGLGGYDLLFRKSQVEYDFTVEAASAGQSTLVLQTIGNINNLMIGDRVINTSIAQFNDSENPITITGVNRTTGAITLSENLDALVTIGTEFTFEFQIGKDTAGIVLVSLGSLNLYEPYKIRMRYWFPDEAFVTPAMVRTLDVNANFPDIANIADNDNLNYKYLYSEDYNINPTPGSNEYGDFNKFYDNRLLVSGGVIGGIDQYDSYQAVSTLSTLTIDYEPPISYAAIKKSIKTGTYTSGLTYINLPITDPIEVGNYVFGIGVSTGTRVSGISINSSIYINNAITSSQTNDDITFVDHRGIAAINPSATWSNGGSTITGLSTITTSNLRVGDVVILNGSPTYNLIATISSTSITTTKTFTASSSTGIDGVAFFYRANGLYNGSLVTYCANVYSGVTTAQSNSGSNVLTIDEDTNIIAGQVVQFGSQIPSGTTVLSIVPNGADFNVTLSNNITDDITSGQLITFAPTGTTDSKEICFPPIDTSPPFNATTLGLQTTTGRPSMTLAPTGGATSEVKFVGLSANNVTIATASSSDNYNRTLTITDGAGNTYDILCTTT